MFLLAASLFFAPQYQVTLDQVGRSVVGDTKGNAYIVSTRYFDVNQNYITKLDPQGHTIYRLEFRIAGVNNPMPDDNGNLYAFTSDCQTQGNFNCAIKLDPAGHIVYKVPIKGDVKAMALGLDGAVYLRDSLSHPMGFSLVRTRGFPPLRQPKNNTMHL